MSKANGNKSELLLGLLTSILIMMGCFVLLDLYVPIKRLLFGDNLNFSEIFAYIKLKEHIPVIIAVSVALVYSDHRKNNKEES
jgi:hypothetical protein